MAPGYSVNMFENIWIDEIATSNNMFWGDKALYGKPFLYDFHCDFHEDINDGWDPLSN